MSTLLRDLSTHARLRLTGVDRVRFLNGLFTNDVAKLAAGAGCHAAMLTVKGKLVGEGLILCDADALWLDLPAEVGPAIRAQMEKHLIVDDVTIEDHGADLDEVLVCGDGARGALEGLVGRLPDLPLYGHVQIGATRVVATTDLGLPGYRLIGGARALAERLAPAARTVDDAEAEVLRIEAGIPRYGVDMGEDHLPIESRLDDAVSHNKGCYMGQEVIARVTARGHINRKLCGLRLEGDRPSERRAKISGPGRDDAGAVTSSVVSPRFGAIALGYVHRSVWAPGTTLAIAEAGGTRTATVVELPFTASAVFKA